MSAVAEFIYSHLFSALMKAIIFHGWGSNSKDNWFPWLKFELEKKGFEVYCPDLPNSQNPKEEEWIKAAMKLSPYDENTIFIGHSLGTVLMMRLLEKQETPIKACYYVSAFDKPLGIAEIKDFFKWGFNYWKIKTGAKKKYILNSDNDPYIPLDTAERLSRMIDAKLIVFKNKEHLSAGTGDCKFPELLELITK
jgi:uncharacterized protein